MWLAMFCAAPVFGASVSLAAACVHHATETWRWARWRWGVQLAYGVIGLPLVVLGFGASILCASFMHPFIFFYGTNTSQGHLLLPDDGLEPFARATLKFQLVSLVIFGAVLSVLGRGASSGNGA